MSLLGWHSLLVLGGIRSGKYRYAESVIAGTGPVRYLPAGTLAADRAPGESPRHDQPGWTTEAGAENPDRLMELITSAAPGETLLVDDLGGWIAALVGDRNGATGHDPAADADVSGAINALTAAIRSCPARLVLVSPEVGFTLPADPGGRAVTLALGEANRAVADACDAVALVIAGQTTWLKGEVARIRPAASADPRAATSPVAPTTTGTVSARAAAAAVSPAAATTGIDATSTDGRQEAAGPDPASTVAALPSVAVPVEIGTGLDLPIPDAEAGRAAIERLATLDVPGSGLGELDQAVRFAAATQGHDAPAPWRHPRALLLCGDHAGGAGAGESPTGSARRAAQARAGEGALAMLAGAAGADLHVVEVPVAAPMEEGPAQGEQDVGNALRYGWHLAEQAVDSGVDVLVLAACGAGTGAAAAAVLAAMSGAEPAAILARVLVPGNRVDDAAWMRRCAAVRDALHRTRGGPRGSLDVLAELAGPDLTVATGVLLGAAYRRTPVLLDGPLGVAAALLGRDFADQARRWCLLPDEGDQPAVRHGADVLGLRPVMRLRLGLGEGAGALAALPLLNSALALCAALPSSAAPAGMTSTA